MFWELHCKRNSSQKYFSLEIGILLEGWGRTGLELFLYKLMVDLYMGTDILSTDRNSVYIFFMTKIQNMHSQIAISCYCILITNFLT